MRIRKIPFTVLFSLTLGVSLVGCSFSLASDITPPPNAETFNSQNALPTISSDLLPAAAPNPQNGQALFQQHCAACHGATGMGDGPQAAQLQVTVPALGDATIAQDSRPVDWFQMVTNGNMSNFMPPFSSVLDASQRWDVVAYAISLSMSQDTLDQGKTVFEANCQSCHGAHGEGAGGIPGWIDKPGTLAALSITDMATVIQTGNGEMPSFASSLSQDQITAAAEYVRSLSFNSSAGSLAEAAGTPGSPTTAAQATTQPGTTTQPEATAQPGTTAVISGNITITGTVTNGSGGSVPPGMTVTLTAFDGMNQAFVKTTTAAADGSFTFPEVELSESRAYMASVDYQGTTFNSDVFHSTDQPGATSVQLPISIYETTTDASKLRVDRMHVFFDFSDPQFVQVAELFVLNNTGTQVIVSPSTTKGVVDYQLPQGATNLQFQDGSLGARYLQTDNGFSDTQSVTPGSGTQILFAYELPYQRKMDISVPIPLPVNSVVVMVPEGGMNLDSSQVQSMGNSEVQGQMIDFYSATSLAAGSTLDLSLSGKASSAVGNTGLSTQGLGLTIGLTVLVLALIGLGYWLFVQHRREAQADEAEGDPVAEGLPDEIMDAIITLDDRYKAGEIPQEAYEQRRAELKDQLKSILGG